MKQEKCESIEIILFKVSHIKEIIKYFSKNIEKIVIKKLNKS